MIPKFDFAKVVVDCEAESDRILNCYVRYMLRKFGRRKFDPTFYITCPRYNEYHSHLNGLIIKANEKLYYKKSNFSYPSSNCKEIDILAFRFIYKKYKINLTYNKRTKLRKNIFLKNYELKFQHILRDILTDLRPNNIKRKKDSNKKDILSRSTILILSHHEDSNYEEAYLNLARKLSKFFKHSNKGIKIIMPNQIGLSIFDKFKNSFLLLKFLLKNFRRNYFLKLSDFHFIILDFYGGLYMNKLKKIFIEDKISLIITSYIDSRYEPIYYEAAKELGIKYCIYDYSLGYPVREFKFIKYLLDTRKYGDIIFANSKFRAEQYKISSSFLDKNPSIIPHISPQVDYSIQTKSPIKLSSYYSSKNVGIVDNILFDDCAINRSDMQTLISLLLESDIDLNFILQSKRGELKKEMVKFNVSPNKYICADKGDFSVLRNADLIVSLGWQSLAIVAASTFNKPLIFYSKSGYPYEDHKFSLEYKKNKKMNILCKNLWMSEKNFKKEICNFFLSQNKSTFIEDNSNALLEEIGFYDENIEYYFNKYFS